MSTVNNRTKVTKPLNARLRQQLEVGILRGFLELHITEMKDEDIRLYFNEARRVVKDDGIYLITKQLAIFREFTSIAARLATLASLTDRKSWPILALTAVLPVLNKLLAMVPWQGKDRRNCIIHLPPLSDPRLRFGRCYQRGIQLPTSTVTAQSNCAGYSRSSRSLDFRCQRLDR